MNVFDAFESTLIDEGKTFPLSDTATITLLPVGGDKARRAFDRMMEPYAPRLKAGGELTEQENKDLNVRFYANHIILNWTGLKGRDNEDLPFSKENAVALLSEPKLAKFFGLIIKMAADDAAFEAAAAEADAGN